jgi:hypothetical protein
MPFLTVIFGLFTGPFGKIFTYGSIILTIAAGAWGYLKYEEHEAAVAATAAALAAFNAQQAAQAAKDNAANAAALQQALSDEEALMKANADLNTQLAAKVGTTNTWIAKQKTSPVDPIFNNTLKMMRGY